MRWSIGGSHCSGPAPWLLLILMDWAISQRRSLTWLSLCCVVKPPFPRQIPIVTTANWLTPTPVFMAQMRTCRDGIWIVLASVKIDFSNQKASHYIIGSQQWSMIEWWISNASYTKQGLGVLNILWRMMQWGSRGEEGVLKVLEIVSKVGRQGKFIYGLGGVFLIWWHHLGCYSARNEFAQHHLSAQIDDRNGTRLSFQVQVRVPTEPLPNWPSGLSMKLNNQVGYRSMVNSEPVRNGQVVSRSPSRSIYWFI